MGKAWQRGEGGILVWLMVALGTALVGGLALLPDLQRNQVLAAEIRRLDEDIDRLGREVALLTHEKVGLETDPVYVERVARRNFHLRKPGEVLFELKPVAAMAEPDASGGGLRLPALWLGVFGVAAAAALGWMYLRSLPGRVPARVTVPANPVMPAPGTPRPGGDGNTPVV